MRQVLTYQHHGVYVKAMSSLVGTHRENCLCWNDCKFFNPEDREHNCPIANELYDFCVKNHMTTPVYECPKFEPK